MVIRNLNWNDIRPINNSLNEGFEELVCQLARIEKIDSAVKFIRKGKPDAGVECFWILDTGEEIAWQAKFFTSSLDETQWRQINKSVSTALAKHPNLKRLYIAIPIDPSDARVGNQKSMLNKWNTHVAQWVNEANLLSRVVEFVPWWSSDLISKIQSADSGFLHFWFNKEEFTTEWFSRQNELAIADLGPRYTPELNVELPISHLFDGLSHNDKYVSEIGRMCLGITQIVRKLIGRLNGKYDMACLSESVDKLDTVFAQYNPRDVNILPVDELLGILSVIKNQAYSLSDKLREESSYYSEYSSSRELIRQVGDFERYLSSPIVALANNPFLLLSGVAGCGKSHLFGDIVARRITENHLSVFALGTYFSTGEDPWLQILKQCDVRCTIDEFLYSLNTLACINQRRIILFIDAVNEGNGKTLWKKYFGSFITRLKKYEWLGLAMSVRSTYINHIFSEKILSSNLLVKCVHRGFEDVTYDAVKHFFHYYGIEMINSPLLVPEFNNPLFLSLFCRGLSRAGYKRVPSGDHGLSSILSIYMDGINSSLSEPDKLDYDDSIKLVQKAVEELAIARIKNRNQPLSIDAAVRILNDVSAAYGVKNGLFKSLVDEHIISKDLGGDGREIVEFSYERLQDYYSASYIVSNTDLGTVFIPGGDYYFLVKDSNKRYYNSGILEALAVILPERKELELYEVLPSPYEVSVAEPFIDSLIWRKTDTISIEKIMDYVVRAILPNGYLSNKYWDVILQISAVPNHPFNAVWLHNYLSRFSMSDRDAWWTIWLKENYSNDTTIGELIQWGYDTDCDNLETIKLICIVLAWFHTSSNRELRDRSTKAMICLLNRHIDILLEIFQLFEEVNDPYILERLYAVAYGTVLQNKYLAEHYSDLVKYVYKTIFDKDKVYPHILLRDYARNIIEYYVNQGNLIEFPIEDIRPPYKSDFNYTALTNEELDERYSPKDVANTERYRYSAQDILDSMTTEHGRGCCRYGDFGRYTFQSALSHWKVNYDALSNLAVEWIFEKYGYDIEKHGRFDRSIGARIRRSTPNERIGKKYQWIAFHEMLARVSDNFDMKEESWREDVIVPYQGPWNPYVRDIDPSVFIREASNELAFEINGWFSNDEEIYDKSPIYEWVKDGSDMPDPLQSLEFVDNNGDSWIVLLNYPEWKENYDDDQEPYKLIWQQVRSYLIRDEEYEDFLDWAKKQDFTGRWMPEPASRYEVFEKEYYWSPAYNDMGMGLEQRIVGKSYDGASEYNIYMTYVEYLWEAENDHSKTEALSYSRPSKLIFDGMGMTPSNREGIWNDTAGNLVCFNASVWHGKRECILIQKDAFLKFINDNKLRVVWTVIGEKNIIRDYTRSPLYDPIEISGCYYFDDNNNIVGNYKTQSIKARYEKAQEQIEDVEHNIIVKQILEGLE